MNAIPRIGFLFLSVAVCGLMGCISPPRLPSSPPTMTVEPLMVCPGDDITVCVDNGLEQHRLNCNIDLWNGGFGNEARECLTDSDCSGLSCTDGICLTSNCTGLQCETAPPVGCFPNHSALLTVTPPGDEVPMTLNNSGNSERCRTIQSDETISLAYRNTINDSDSGLTGTQTISPVTVQVIEPGGLRIPTEILFTCPSYETLLVERLLPSMAPGVALTSVKNENRFQILLTLMNELGGNIRQRQLNPGESVGVSDISGIASMFATPLLAETIGWPTPRCADSVVSDVTINPWPNIRLELLVQCSTN